MLRKHHSKIDIEVLEDVAKVLLPFKEVTTIMSTESSSSISLIRPLLSSLMEHAKPSQGDSRMVHQSKAAIYHDLQKRLELTKVQTN